MSSRSFATHRLIAITALPVLLAVGCSSGGDDPIDNDPVTSVGEGTVVPPDNQGVGGGEPIDNLDDDANDPAQGVDESDVDSNNGG